MCRKGRRIEGLTVREACKLGRPIDGASAQTRIDAWHRERFGEVRPGELSLRLLREAVELCLADGVSLGRIGAAVSVEGAAQRYKAGGPPHIGSAGPDERRAEAADVGVLLMALAGREGFDLLDAIAERHAHNQTREVMR
jgi:hypothetical protein